MLYKILMGIDGIHKVICKIFVNTATICLIIMTLIIVVQVLLRYFFNSPLPWPEEVAVYLMLWMSYLCLPYLVYSNQNVSITFLPDYFKGTKVQYILEIIYVMFILFTGVIWYPFAIQGMQNGFLITLSQIPISMGIILTIVPVSLFFMITIAAQKLFLSVCMLLGVDFHDIPIFQSFLQDSSEEL